MYKYFYSDILPGKQEINYKEQRQELPTNSIQLSKNMSI